MFLIDRAERRRKGNDQHAGEYLRLLRGCGGGGSIASCMESRELHLHGHPPYGRRRRWETSRGPVIISVVASPLRGPDGLSWRRVLVPGAVPPRPGWRPGR